MHRNDDLKVAGLGCGAFLATAFGAILVNLVVIGAAVWVVVKVLQWTGVL